MRTTRTAAQPPRTSQVGTVIRAPQLFRPPDRPTTCSLRIAVDRWDDSQIDTYDVVCWRELAEHVAESIHKGDQVIVRGTHTVRTWTGGDGLMRSHKVIAAEAIGPDLRFVTAEVTYEPDGGLPLRAREGAGSAQSDGRVHADQQRLPLSGGGWRAKVGWNVPREKITDIDLPTTNPKDGTAIAKRFLAGAARPSVCEVLCALHAGDVPPILVVGCDWLPAGSAPTGEFRWRALAASEDRWVRVVLDVAFDDGRWKGISLDDYDLLAQVLDGALVGFATKEQMASLSLDGGVARWDDVVDELVPWLVPGAPRIARRLSGVIRAEVARCDAAAVGPTSRCTRQRWPEG